jgi:hypothetical protein
MFPFYCGYTNFTVYAWEVGANIEDKAQATAKYVSKPQRQRIKC